MGTEEKEKLDTEQVCKGKREVQLGWYFPSLLSTVQSGAEKLREKEGAEFKREKKNTSRE